MSNRPTVGPMLKIFLSLKITGDEPEAPATPPSTSFDFIFGLGTHGLSPFEKALYGKAEGDTLSIRLENHTMQAYFDHLLCPLMEVAAITPPADLEAAIDAVRQVSDRDIVRAMAQKAGGCDGDCDCGCGC